MSDSGNVVGILFGIVGSVFAALGPAMAVAAVHRARLRARTLANGLVAQAVCLETYVTEERVGTDLSDRRTRSVRHVILGFRTFDGRDVRFRDTSGAPRVVGDHVPVRYLPDRPHRAVTADRGTSGAVAGAVVATVFGLVFAVTGLFFAFLGFGIATGGDGIAPAPDGRTVCTWDRSAARLACPDGVDFSDLDLP
ncbi:DUF3592 domain-containing protein [Kitasatospora sp. NBC_01560]|uniref:DUF3592 domain-containing protein n=1 Tax=Kitasatospora sp. NBC_01560 TaxID=2975965 RepID=UPI0038686322